MARTAKIEKVEVTQTTRKYTVATMDSDFPDDQIMLEMTFAIGDDSAAIRQAIRKEAKSAWQSASKDKF